MNNLELCMTVIGRTAVTQGGFYFASTP